MNNAVLRKELQKITDSEDISQHPTKISHLSSKFFHSIHPLSDYDPANRQNYNCFEYALDLHITCHYSVLVTLFALGVGLDYRFVNYLIQHEVLKQILSSEVKLDDLLIYFHNDLPAHAGKWKGNNVISKWGKGLLYEHGIYEVPIKYGDPQYFRKVHPQVAKDYLIRYAKQNRVSDEYLEDV
jgi:hypothetical protein